MASFRSLKHIFENPLPENPSLIESLSSSSSSWKTTATTEPTKPINHSFTEIFGELHFKENPQLLLFPSALPSSPDPVLNSYNPTGLTRKGFSSPLSFESLQMCTEGLGSESLDDIDDLKRDTATTITTTNNNNNVDNSGNLSSISSVERADMRSFDHHQYRRSRSTGERMFPPPISSIGRNGKPGVCFKSYRRDGRFVLQEVRIPTQEFLHASREDGRLRLRLVQPERDVSDQEDEEEEGKNNDREENQEEVVREEEGEKNGQR